MSRLVLNFRGVVSVVVHRLLLVLGLSSFFAFGFISCTKNTKGFVTPSVNAITLATVLGKSVDSWNIDNLNQVYLTSKEVTFTGTCPRDTDLIVMINGEKESQPAKCSAQGKYSWTKVFPADGAVDFKLVSSKDSSTQFSRKLVVDTTPPPAPVILTNGGIGFSSPTSSFLLSGTVSSDSVNLEVDATGTLSLANPDYDFSTTLNWGQARVFSLVAVDFAGNRSTPSTITVTYQTPTEMTQSGITSFGLDSDQTGSAGSVLSSNAGEAFANPTGPLVSTGGNINLTLGLVSVGFLPEP